MAKVIKKKKLFSGESKALSLERRNYLILGIGVLTIIIGYIVMATGDTYSFQSLTLAPIILLIGYLILIPLALLYRRRSATPPPDSKE